MDSFLRRETPNNYEAEQSVIGAMLLDKDAIRIASEILKSDDFYHGAWTMWRSVQRKNLNS